MTNEEIDERLKAAIDADNYFPKYDNENCDPISAIYLRAIMDILGEITKRLPEPNNKGEIK